MRRVLGIVDDTTAKEVDRLQATLILEDDVLREGVIPDRLTAERNDYEVGVVVIGIEQLVAV